MSWFHADTISCLELAAPCWIQFQLLSAFRFLYSLEFLVFMCRVVLVSACLCSISTSANVLVRDVSGAERLENAKFLMNNMFLVVLVVIMHAIVYAMFLSN